MFITTKTCITQLRQEILALASHGLCDSNRSLFYCPMITILCLYLPTPPYLPSEVTMALFAYFKSVKAAA